MRVGLFGGSFDPPHAGHAALARAAVRELKLHRLYVVPAGDPPLKPARPSAASRRLSLSRTAFGRLPRVVVSPWEVRRPGVSYTHKTLAAFRRRHPRAEWFLVMGEDAWGNFRRWKRWREILKMARLAVGRRAGARAGSVPIAVRTATVLLKVRLPRISSTEIRLKSKGS